MQQNEILAVLCRIPLFATTDKAVLADVLAQEGATLQTAKCGEQIGADDRRALGILLSGRAQIRSADTEKAVILRTVSAGEIFDAAALFLDNTPPMSHITADTACTALFLDVALVRTLMTRSAAFLDAYLAFLAGRVQFLNQKIRCFTAGSAERRLACWLLAECKEGETVTVSLTALADILDIGRASLYRSLDKLEADGVIRHNGRSITLLLPQALLHDTQ